MAELIKNGITQEDVSRAYREGYEEAWAVATPGVIKTVYAGVLLAAHRQLGFGRERCRRLLNEIDNIVTEQLTGDEAVQQAYKEIGLMICFEEPFNRIVEEDSGNGTGTEGS